MSIIKNKLTRDFTIVANYILEDKNLSISAKGFVSWICSRPDDWNFSLSGMASNLNISKPTVLKLINELCSLGYMIKSSNRVNGRQSYNTYELVDNTESKKQSQKY